MRRREFIKVFVGSAVWLLAARAQTSEQPAIGFLSARSAKESAHLVDAFRRVWPGLVDGQNVTIDYRWADSHYERLPATAFRSFGSAARGVDISRRAGVQREITKGLRDDFMQGARSRKLADFADAVANAIADVSH